MSEQLQVVAFLTKPDFCEPYVGLHRDSMTTGTSEPLMTVAQHDRILKAKDAEIARLSAGLKVEAEEKHEALAELRELRAQPARQVGDEPIRDDDLVLVPRGLLGAARYAIKNKVDAPNVHGQLGEYCYGQAALAPAAVVEVDIVETLIQAIDAEQERLSSEDDYLMDSDDCIEVIRGTVANLNRRAIPVGLLERVCAIAECEGQPEGDELRALLGKEGE